MRVQITADEIASAEFARAAYSAASMSPERLGEAFRQGHASHFNDFAARERERLALSNPDDDERAELESQLARYKAAYVQRCRTLLGRTSRTASAFVVGPANFPTQRNQKRLDSEHRAMEDLLEFSKKAEARIRQFTSDPRGEHAPVHIGSAEGAQRLTEKGKAEGNDLETAKAVNAQFRVDLKKVGYDEAARNALRACPESLRKEAASNMAVWHGMPFPSYWLTNTRARMKRNAAQAQAAQTLAATLSREWEGAGVTIIDNAEAERVQIVFDQRQDAEMTKRLKGNGWRWSPTNGAWQRHRTPMARYDAGRLLGIDVT